jgi:sulfoxide reductase heme-binding subunit YedZ
MCGKVGFARRATEGPVVVPSPDHASDMRRLSHHVLLAGLSLSGATVAMGAEVGADVRESLSLATAYLCLALLAAALSIGPVLALRSGHPAVNNHSRRDIGIWAGLNGLAHVWLGTLVSMNAAYVAAFVKAAAAPPSAAVRNWLFGAGAVAGYLVGILLLLLLALSSDRALRRLGAPRWKRLQRASYVAFALTALHGLAFQVVESRAAALVVLLAALTLAVLALHLAARRAVYGLARGARTR